MQGYGTNFRAPKVDVHSFSMIPRADIPRSSFRMQHQHKTTISASNLIPVFVQEVLPGDSFNVSMTAFCRMSTLLFPLMDNLDLESWFFFVPSRIIWQHWTAMCGEQPQSPSDSISFTVPQIVSPVGGFAAFSIYDYMGIPGVGQIGGANTISVNALPLRAYAQITAQWFRDENLEGAMGTGATGLVSDIGDGPDPYTNYTVFPVSKRHDYFTSCLPWTQKGGVAVTLPLGTSATVRTSATQLITSGAVPAMMYNAAASMGTVPGTSFLYGNQNSAGNSLISYSAPAGTTASAPLAPSNLYADLSTATAATINSIRLAFQTQRLLERDARGGTRYQEVLMAHFSVRPLDARVQKPELLGSGKSPVQTFPVPQTAQTGLTGGTSPLGTLAAQATVVHRHGFSASFTEFGYVLGLVAVRADPVYQQGLHRMWTRSTRYDFYWPVFAMLGEQGVRNDEIYCVGTPAQDTAIFGYQERWAEYRYYPSRVSGAFRSTYTTPLDAWHLAQKFTALPVLNGPFIGDVTSATLVRNLAAGALANNEQFLCDFFFDAKVARPMPMFSVPGMVDHF